MRAGDLRHRITFQVRDGAQDGTGAVAQTWKNVFDAWANIQPLSGREIMAARAVQAELTHQIETRYRPELASPCAVAAMRILYNGRCFDLHSSINEGERNEKVMISAAEGLSNG